MHDDIGNTSIESNDQQHSIALTKTDKQKTEIENFACLIWRYACCRIHLLLMKIRYGNCKSSAETKE